VTIKAVCISTATSINGAIMRNVNIVWLVVIAGILFVTGCNNVMYSAKEESKYVKPTIAVKSFENRAPAPYKWNLGDGLADQLIDRLISTRRYVVLERQQLESIFEELNRTDDDRFRQEGRPGTGRLKHVRYLVKGIITDFGFVETVEGVWQIFDWGWLGSSKSWVVAGTVQVIDIQSGQLIASKSVEAKIRGKKGDRPPDYDNMAFGGHTFYHTPLGRATNKMLDKAVREITRAIADQPFQPKIASIINNRIVINGGKDRRIEIGYEYVVRPCAQTVSDPDTGDLLGHIAGQPIGRVRVTQVTPKYSICRVTKGSGFDVGQTLFRVETEATPRPATRSLR